MIMNLRFHVMGNLLTIRRAFSCPTITAPHGDSYIIAATIIGKNTHTHIYIHVYICTVRHTELHHSEVIMTSCQHREENVPVVIIISSHVAMLILSKGSTGKLLNTGCKAYYS